MLFILFSVCNIGVSIGEYKAYWYMNFHCLMGAASMFVVILSFEVALQCELTNIEVNKQLQGEICNFYNQ